MSETGRIGRLEGHLGLVGATALAVTVVVGSGALVLPGLTYQQAGDAAIYAWMAAILITVPLLLVFAELGARHPGAGGVAGFVQAAFGRLPAAGVEVLAMGTFGLGLPGIALTGGSYVQALPLGDSIPAEAGGAVLIACAATIVFIGVKLSTRVQVVLAVTLVVAILAVGVAGSFFGDGAATTLPAPDGAQLAAALGAVGAVFFAFTGWEMIAFTTEEYRDPRRDFPRVVALSFGLVTVMYLLLAYAVQSTLDRGDEDALAAPVQAVATESISPTAGGLIAALGVIIVLANLIGAIWGASRLVMSSGREGLLPAWVARLSHGGQPRRSVAVVAVVLLSVIAASAAGVASMAELLTIAGHNFFLMYLLCAVAYVRLTTGFKRWYGVAVSAGLATLALATFAPTQLGYAAVLFAGGAGLATLRRRPAGSKVP